MKKMFLGFFDNYKAPVLILLLLFVSFFVEAQKHQDPTLWGKREFRTVSDSAMQGPTGCGAPTSLNITSRKQFGQYYDSCNKRFYIYDPKLNAWDTIHVGVAGSGWSLTGNAGTTSGTNFIGTTDAQDFVIKTNGNQLGRISGDANYNVYFGKDAYASGVYAMAYGRMDTASGSASFASGNTTMASGNVSTAMGEATLANGDYTMAVNHSTTATGYASFAANEGTSATGNYTGAFGYGNKSKSYGGFVIGTYNDSTDATDPNAYNGLNRVFQIGNGTSNSARSNAMTVLTNGAVYLPGLASGAGTKALRINPGTGLITYADTTAGGGGTPSLTTNQIGYGVAGLLSSNDKFKRYDSLLYIESPSGISNTIHLETDSTFTYRAKIEGGRIGGTTTDAEGALFFATGGNPVFELYAGENNSMKLWSEGHIDYVAYNGGWHNFTGNVGIGTSSPDSALHVVGGFKLVNGSQGAGKVLTSSATGAASWQTLSVPVGSITGLGTGVATALAVNTGTAGAFVVNGGALGTPSSGTVTNLTGTASININGTVGATTPTTGAFTTLSASSYVTTVKDSITGNGALNSPAISGRGTWITGGTATTTKPYLLIEPSGTTSTAWNTSGTGIGINAASGFAGNLIDAKINNTSQLSLDQFRLTLSGGLTVGSNGTFNGQYNYMGSSTTGVYFTSSKLEYAYNSNSTQTLPINQTGFQELSTQFRNVNIYNGKGASVMYVDGAASSVGVGTTSVAASAIVDLTSTTKGFLPPRMTATQASAISSPAEGLMVYVTNTNGTFTAKGWWGYDGAAWQKLNN